jgi:hypothetical protein
MMRVTINLSSRVADEPSPVAEQRTKSLRYEKRNRPKK